MFAEDIHDMASGLIKKYGADPRDIALGLGIKLIMNYEFRKLCGMYIVIKRRRIIILNGNLGQGAFKTALAHEIGHDRLHRDLAANRVVHDVMLYDMSARPEYEANTFAAELLIPDQAVLEFMRDYGYSAEQTAAGLGFDPNLVAIKLMSMRLRGFDVSDDITADSRFLSGSNF